MRSSFIIRLAILLLFIPVYGFSQASSVINQLEKQAESGDIAAMNDLGRRYRYGDHAEKNMEKAISWYEKAAGMKSPNAMFMLGQIYEKGDDQIAGNLQKSVEWYTKMHDITPTDIIEIKIGDLYKAGSKELGQNYNTAVKWYEKAAQKGNANAMYNLGTIYLFGGGDIVKDTRKANEWYKKAKSAAVNAGVVEGAAMDGMIDNATRLAKDIENETLAEQLKWKAERGDSRAMYDLGLMYENGNGVEKDKTKAKEWYEKAMEKGGIYADLSQQHTAQMTRLHGENAAVPVSDKQEQLKQANQGDARAMYMLGVTYANEGNIAEAEKWLKKAAAKGGTSGAAAQNRLKEMEIAGQLSSQETTDPNAGLRAKAETGDVEAMYKLANELLHSSTRKPYGKGTYKIEAWNVDKEAYVWYQKAANAGNADAMYMLYEMYDIYTAGVPEKDNTKKCAKLAFKWLQLAAKNGHIKSMYLLGEYYFGTFNISGLKPQHPKYNMSYDWHSKVVRHAPSSDDMHKTSKKRLEEIPARQASLAEARARVGAQFTQTQAQTNQSVQTQSSTWRIQFTPAFRNEYYRLMGTSLGEFSSETYPSEQAVWDELKKMAKSYTWSYLNQSYQYFGKPVAK